MNEEVKPDFRELPEKSPDQIHKELVQLYDQIKQLSNQIYELIIKARIEGLSKEEMNSIFNEARDIADQLNEKIIIKNQLEDQDRNNYLEEINKLKNELE